MKINKNIKIASILLLLTLFFFSFTIDVKAESMASFFKCPDEIIKGKVFSCDVYINTNSNDKVTKIMGSLTQEAKVILDHYEKGKYITDEKVTYHNFNYTSSEGVPDGETIFKIYVKIDKNTEYKEGDFQLFLNEIKFKNGGSLKNIDLKSNKISFLTNPNPESSECHLQTLEVSDGTLKPSFNMDTLEYNITTEKEEINLTATALDKTAKVEIPSSTNNKVKLNIGKNEITIKVTAEDGTIKTYKITITRTENGKTNSNSNTNNKDDDLKLQLLSVDGEKIQLKDNNYNYSIDVPYETTKANLLYATSTSTSKVDVTGSENLKVGENSIILKVTSESGKTAKYYLIINRGNEVKSNDSSIKKLEVLNADSFNFSSDNQNYIIKVPKKVDKLKLNIELADSNATYTITGNENLKDNSKVIIKVTAADESTTTYSLLIEKNKDNNLMIVLIIFIAISVAFLIAVFSIFNKKMKKDKKIENKIEETPNKESKIELENPEFVETEEDKKL